MQWPFLANPCGDVFVAFCQKLCWLCYVFIADICCFLVLFVEVLSFAERVFVHGLRSGCNLSREINSTLDFKIGIIFIGSIGYHFISLNSSTGH